MNFKAKILLLNICSVMVLASSCKKDTGGTSAVTPTGKADLFNAAVSGDSITRVNTNWQSTDTIGIIMRTLEESTVLAENKKYIPGANGSFVPLNSDVITYPADGTLVNFIAYYPYQSSADSVYKVDVTKQDNPAAIDLLYAANATNFSALSTTTPYLQFEHQLGKVVLNITKDPGLTAGLKGLDVTVGGMGLTADFMLHSGTMNHIVNGDLKPARQSTDTSEIATFLAIPGNVTGQIVTIKLASGKKYTWAFPSGAAIVNGKTSTFNILLQPPVEQQMFLETFGAQKVTVATKIADFTGWDNPQLTFTDTSAAQSSQIRTNTPFSQNHVQMSSRGAALRIAGINTDGYTNMKLSFDLVTTPSTPIDLSGFKVYFNGVAYPIASQMSANNNTIYPITINLSSAAPSVTGTLDFVASVAGYRLDNVKMIGTK